MFIDYYIISLKERKKSRFYRVTTSASFSTGAYHCLIVLIDLDARWPAAIWLACVSIAPSPDEKASAAVSFKGWHFYLD